MDFLKKNFILRHSLYITFYLSVFFLYDVISQKLYVYQVANTDPYINYIPLAVLLSFSYLKWQTIKSIPKYKNSKVQTTIFAMLAIGILLIPLNKVLDTSQAKTVLDSQIPFLFYWSQIILSYIFFFLAVFNWKFVKKFKTETIVIVLGLILYLTTQLIVQLYWQKFSLLITYAISHILPLFTHLTYTDLDTFQIRMLDFNVYIGPPCAGVYSMTTFTFLFITTLVFIRKTQSIDPFKTFFALLFGILATFLLNIVRVTTIILVGAYYSQKLAIDLFHEYLSAIFLIALFMAYLYWIIPRLIEKPRKRD